MTSGNRSHEQVAAHIAVPVWMNAAVQRDPAKRTPNGRFAKNCGAEASIGGPGTWPVNAAIVVVEMVARAATGTMSFLFNGGGKGVLISLDGCVISSVDFIFVFLAMLDGAAGSVVLVGM